MQKPKYITNKDLLREIHRSKATFCHFEQPQYADFDVIVQSVEGITPELITQVLEKKRKPKSRGAVNDVPIDVGPEDLVFRVMTHEHIPLDPNRKRKARNTDVSYARTNFPPFKHYVLRAGELVEVGRSHWKGDLQAGEFCLDKGAISNSLAVMFMLLVDRISRRGNWRGYCVDEASEALTKRGWLGHDEINTDDMILSYDQGALKWSKIKSIFRDTYSGNMFHLTAAGMDALVTPGHKFVTQDGLKPVEYLLQTDKVITMGKPESGPHQETYSDEFVEMVGRVATEGRICREKSRACPHIRVYPNEGASADRVRACLQTLGSRFGELHPLHGRICFTLSEKLRSQIGEVLDPDGKVLTMPFILALSQRQRELLIDTMIDGNGYRTHGNLKRRRYSRECKRHVDAFAALCTLAGFRVSTKHVQKIVSYGKAKSLYQVSIFSGRANHSRVENIDFHGGKRNGTINGRGEHIRLNEPTIPYEGEVWCPETEFGSFVARRNGHIYLTGNSYVDEMRSHALMQLSQVGLQFDEAKSDNPFAFYTTTIRNSFTRVLNLEKKNQNIRDDMLIVSGVTPSYTRQIENEIEYRFPVEAGNATTKKRGTPGRKPSKAKTATKAE